MLFMLHASCTIIIWQQDYTMDLSWQAAHLAPLQALLGGRRQ